MFQHIIVVGQGLAGSVLALELLNRGCRVTVLDDQREGSASPVAAGMFNPMSFRRIIPVWRADEVMAAKDAFYARAEQFLNAHFFHRVPLVKIFPNEAYATLWQQRIDEGLGWIAPGPSLPLGVKAPFGCGLVPDAGYVDLPVFMAAVSDRLTAEESLHRVRFDEHLLKPHAEGLIYDDPDNGLRLSADAIVLATGAFARGTGMLGDLPLQTNKGEVLTVSTDLRSEVTLNNGKWLLPLGAGRYRLGSSYLPGVEEAHPTGQVAKQLLEKAAQMIEADLEVLDHRAGLRPTVSDRRPLLGQSALPRVFHFNGLGTRGVLNAPLLARWMTAHLLNERLLDDEVNVDRFGRRGK